MTGSSVSFQICSNSELTAQTVKSSRFIIACCFCVRMRVEQVFEEVKVFLEKSRIRLSG